MKTIILVAVVALGCAFWLLPLSLLGGLAYRHGTPEDWYGFYYEGAGFSYDLLLLFGIPLLMLALTMWLGWRAKRGRLAGAMILASSFLAVFAGSVWCLISYGGN